MLRRPTILSAAACAAALATVAPAAAQNTVQRDGAENTTTRNASTQQNARGNAANGLLQVDAGVPNDARVGEQFNFDIRLKNVSSDVELYDVKLKVKTPGELIVEDAKLDGKSTKQDDGSMTVDMLGPGESKTINVTASAEKEGDIQACLLVSDYTPAVCLRMSAVKPELDIVKQAPETARLCEEIVFKYQITNGGSADIKGFTVTDELPEGLMTIEGEDTLNFQVDGLKAGDTRAFEARLRADKAGEFSSRAVAKATEFDLKARSKQTTTTVQAARLAAEITGPSEVYLGQPVTYTLRVSNLGNVPAENTLVAFEYPTNATIAGMSDVKNSGRKVKRAANNRQPTAAEGRNRGMGARGQNARNNEGRNNNRDADARMADVDIADESWDLGNLKAGETREMTVTLKPTGGEVIRPMMIAEADCSIGDDAEASRLTSTRYARTEIVTLPAMLLEAYDNEQVRPADGTITYTVRILNQGDAADNDVKLTATLPEGISFASAEGPTDITADGQKLTFGTIDTFEAGEQATWKIKTNTDGEGDVRFKVELNTESLTEPATAEEPTRLLSQK